ncbi:hypothetical protein PUR31_01280 [Pseudomonas mosselii]|uniref:hypothetical protein n=1 Tax=unclassified Pseudomonas TaxID=196821 RepID=UPI0020C32477|nr:MULTISPECIES: hypothetical protein [unclassified Pseudomonas]MCP8634161.1 hypothetical protein [Pseudomonas sp. DVZ6]MDD7782723.1 hypothetical protein [Pseudomonas sp. DVZ24]
MSDTPSVLRKLAIRLLGLVVVLPVFLVTGYCTTFAVFLLPGMIYNGFDDPWDYQLNRIGLVIVLLIGLIGVNTGLKLYRHFLRSTRAPEWIGSAWAGLRGRSKPGDHVLVSRVAVVHGVSGMAFVGLCGVCLVVAAKHRMVRDQRPSRSLNSA